MFKVTFPNLNYKFNEVQTKDYSELHGEPRDEFQKHNELEEKIITIAKHNTNITRTKIGAIIGVSRATVGRILQKTTKIKYVGSGKYGHWEIK